MVPATCFIALICAAEPTRAFRDIIVTESNHPYVGNWWPPGHLIGYEHSFVHTVADFVKAVIARKKIEPDFADALKTQRVIDRIQRARPLSSL
jgi:predicted dehydrogenase